MIATTAPTKQATAEDYFALPEGARVQLIDGELVDMSPAPSFQHQEIVLNIASLLRAFVKAHGLGKVGVAPIDVQLSPTQIVQPDVLFISKEHLQIVDKIVYGTPDLVVEVLSPSNARYDLMNKMRIYATAGVTEYWIVDPEDQTMRFYDNRQGTFAEFDYLSKSKTVASSKLLAGLDVKFEEVFESIE